MAKVEEEDGKKKKNLIPLSMTEDIMILNRIMIIGNRIYIVNPNEIKACDSCHHIAS